MDIKNGHIFKNYLGFPGAGKTLSAVIQEILPRYLEGQVIYSTTWLNLQGIHYFSSLDELEGVKNAVIFIDEIGQYLDPYAWKYISYNNRMLFQNHRKLKLTIISTTQDLSFIAKPARVLINDWVFCENNSHGVIMAKILAFFGIKEIIVKQLQLSVIDLLKLQKGVSSVGVIQGENTDDLDNDFSDDFTSDLDFSKDDLENKPESVHFSMKKIIRRDLDYLKEELVYFYCPLCESRQYYNIKQGQEHKYFNIYKYKGKDKFYNKMNYFFPAHPKQRL